MKIFAANLRPRGFHRRAIVSVVVLIVLMLITGLIAQYARRALSDRRQMRSEMQHQQALHLADAGVMRLRQSVATGGDVEAENWNVPVGIIHQTNTGTVEITLKDGTATIVARYPANAEYPVKVTRTVPLESLP